MQTHDGQNDRPDEQLEKTYIEDGVETSPGSLFLGPPTEGGDTREGAPGGEPPARTGPVVDRENTELAGGTVVGTLGDGGMARVYKVWNQKLEVHRAVKILRSDQSDSLRNRFETEAKIVAKLHHPHIVEIHSVGEHDGLPYIEMEYIDGWSLDHLIGQHGRLPDAVCCAIAIGVADALAYAHAQEVLIYGKTYRGIIHRDLKPANIMVGRDGAVKLMDFGIARPTEASLHTVEGMIVGTMQYLSPEQLDGEKKVDRRADIYSLGAILYEMLTGTKTFPQNTITALMRRKSTSDYRKFSEFDFRAPRTLTKIAQRCLALDKDDRYPDAEALLANLRKSYASLTSVSPRETMRGFAASPAGRPDETPGRLARIGVPVGLGIAAVVAVGIGVRFLMPGGHPEQPAKPTPMTEAAAPAPTGPAAQPPVSETDAAESIPPAPAPPEEPERSQPKTRRVATPSAQTPEPSPKTTRRSRTPSARAPSSTPTAPAKPSTKPQPEQSPVERLLSAYGTSDFVDIGARALEKKAYSDAILALEQVDKGHRDYTRASVYLLETYVQAGRVNEARTLVRERRGVKDAQFDLLAGELARKGGDADGALERYQAAMLKPSVVRPVSNVRSDALCYIARIRTAQYRADSTPENRIQALNAWFALKRHHVNDQSHPRFKEANTTMAGIR